LLDITKDYGSIILSDIFKLEYCSILEDLSGNYIHITIEYVHSEEDSITSVFFFTLTNEQAASILNQGCFSPTIRTGKE
jgi:hypothetical protein